MNKLSRRQVMLGTTVAAATPLLGSIAAAQTTHAVTIKGFAFEPANLSIKAGDSVIFTNEDSAPHTATADNGSFDTGRLDRGQASTVSFSGSGSFSYFCAFHPNMKGSITVS